MRWQAINKITLKNSHIAFLALIVVALLQAPSLFLTHYKFVSLGIIISEVFIIFGVPILFAFWFDLDRRAILNFRRMPVGVWWALVIIMFGVVTTIDYLSFASEYFFPLPGWFKDTLVKLMSANSVPVFFLKLFLLCVLPAICEEVLFRGFCQNLFVKKFGPWKAIFISAFLFSIFHKNPWYIHLYFLLGVVFGWVYFVTGSLWAPCLCHFLNNLWTYVAFNSGLNVLIKSFPVYLDAAVFAVGVLVLVLSIRFLKSRPLPVNYFC